MMGIHIHVYISVVNYNTEISNLYDKLKERGLLKMIIPTISMALLNVKIYCLMKLVDEQFEIQEIKLLGLRSQRILLKASLKIFPHFLLGLVDFMLGNTSLI